jgi:hypothetical protein
MSMRLYTENEFHSELHKHGFEATTETTKTSTLWRRASDGMTTLVPRNQDAYPDHILESLLLSINELYVCPEDSHNVTYAVEGKVVSIPQKICK